MKKIFPIDNESTSLRSITSKPITQAQYNDLVDRVTELATLFENGQTSLEEFQEQLALAFSSANVTAGTLVVNTDATIGNDVTVSGDLTVGNAIIAALTNTNATITEAVVSVLRNPTAYITTATINHLTSNDVTSTTVDATTGTFTTVNADNINAENLNIENLSVENYDTTNVTAETGTIDTLTSTSITATNSDIGTATADEITTGDITANGVIAANTIVHNINAQTLDDQDYYILSIPEFTNGTYRIIGKNEGDIIYSIEIWNGDKNWMFRWSQIDLGYIDKFIMNDNKLYIRVKGANTIYHISDTAENEDILTIENDYTPTGSAFTVGDVRATYIANGIFLGEVRADNINFDNVTLTDIMLRNTLYIYNSSSGVYEAGSVGQILQVGEAGKIYWVDVLNNTTYPTQLVASDKLITANTLSNYDGSTLVQTGEADVTISTYKLLSSEYTNSTSQEMTVWDYDGVSVTATDINLYKYTLLDTVTSLSFRPNPTTGEICVKYVTGATSASIVESIGYLNLILASISSGTKGIQIFNTSGTLLTSFNVDNTGLTVSTNNTTNITLTSNYNSASITIAASDLAVIRIESGYPTTNMYAVMREAINNGKLAYNGNLEIGASDFQNYFVETEVDADLLMWPYIYAHVIETASEYPITEIGNNSTVHGTLTADSINVNNDVNITGDLYVSGTTHTVEEETVSTTSDIVTLRANNSTSLSTGEVSGIVVNKYNGTDDLALVTDSTGTLRVGTGAGTDTTYLNVYYDSENGQWLDSSYVALSPQPSGTLTSWTGKDEQNPYTYYETAVFTVIDETSLEPILTRSEESDLTDNGLLKWDATNVEATTIDAPSAANQRLTYNGTDYEWTDDVTSAGLSTTDDFVYVRKDATTAGDGGIDVVYSANDDHGQIYIDTDGSPAAKNIDSSDVETNDYKLTQTTSQVANGIVVATDAVNHTKTTAAATGNDEVLQYNSTSGNYEWTDSPEVDNLQVNTDANVTGTLSTESNYAKIRKDASTAGTGGIDVTYGANGEHARIRVSASGQPYFTTLDSSDVVATDMPLVQKTVDDTAASDSRVAYFTDTNTVSRLSKPSTAKSVLTQDTSGAPYWTSLSALTGKVAFIGTRAEYNVAVQITEGNTGFIPSGALVIITDEDNYIEV